jgi:hypothetical protein
MKKILAIILSFQFMVIPVSFGQQDAYQTTGNGSKGGFDFYSNQILVLATSSIGSSIISQCLAGLKIPSIATFMSGSIVHMASEVLGAKAQNEDHKNKLSDLKILEDKLAKGGGELQKEALLAQKKQEEQTRDFLKQRKIWMTAISVIYAAAAGLAIAEEAWGHAAGVTAGTAACTPISSALGAACLVGAAACVAAEQVACLALMSSGTIAAEAAFASPTAPATGNASCLTNGPFSPACVAYLNAYNLAAYGGCINTSSPAKAISWSKILSFAYGFGMGKIDGGEISQYGSMLMALLPMVIPSLSSMVGAAYNFPIPRSITFGASAVLATSVTTGLFIREGIAEKNIATLDKVISKFKLDTDDPNGLSNDPAGISGNTGSNAMDPKNQKYDVKMLPTAQTPGRNCISDQGNSFDVSEKACGNIMKVARPNFDFKLGVGTLSNVGNLAANMADSVAQGDFAKANGIAAEIGSMAARVKDVNDKLQANYNSQQKAQKQPETDFQKAIGAQVGSMQSALNNAAASSGMNLANTPSTLPQTQPIGVDKNSAVSGVNSINKSAVNMPPADMKVDFSEGQTSVENLPVAKTASLTDGLHEYEANEQDISKQSDVSIFKQVSNRYLLNYTRIFEKKKSIEPATNK